MAATARLPPPPFLYPILDAGLLRGRPLSALVAALADAGVGIVQLRAKVVDDRALLALAAEAVETAHARGMRLLVNDRADVARIVGADGVHVGQDDLPPRAVRAVLGPAAIVGISSHDLEQARQAAGEPVDYVAFGPVFPTRTKEDHEPLVGLDGLRRVRAVVGCPLVAIGGIGAGNAGEVVRAGADGAAVISDLMSAEDVTERARRLLALLRAGASGGPAPAGIG